MLHDVKQSPLLLTMHVLIHGFQSGTKDSMLPAMPIPLKPHAKHIKQAIDGRHSGAAFQHLERLHTKLELWLSERDMKPTLS